LKSIDLQIRPVHHSIESRVRAHVCLCMLAYYVEWHLREVWAPSLFQDHDRVAAQRARISPVAAAQISEAARRKRNSLAAKMECRSPASLACSITSSPRVAHAQYLRLAAGPQRHLVATSLQEKAFSLLATPSRVSTGQPRELSPAWPRLHLSHENFSLKKSLRAAEQDRPDIAAARTEWRERQPSLDPGKLIFIDETWTKTNMGRSYGRAAVSSVIVLPQLPKLGSIGAI
jgi:hypothetical protein